MGWWVGRRAERFGAVWSHTYILHTDRYTSETHINTCINTDDTTYRRERLGVLGVVQGLAPAGELALGRGDPGIGGARVEDHLFFWERCGGMVCDAEARVGGAQRVGGCLVCVV